jgi:hypothetical protein
MNNKNRVIAAEVTKGRPGLDRGAGRGINEKVWMACL